MTTEKYPIKKSMILDIMSTALSIEDYFSQFLIKPPIGAYLKGGIEPVLLAGIVYHQFVTVDDPVGKVVPVAVTSSDIESIESAVYSENGEIVVTHRTRHLLVPAPTVPVIGIKIIRELVDEFLQRNQAWTGLHRGIGVRPIEDESLKVVAKYVIPNVCFSTYTDIAEELMTQMRSLRYQIATFIGDDEWCVHLTEDVGSRAILLSKSIDYRIADWTERMNTGEFKK